MVGTITNIPLSQRFDKTNGKFLAGGKLYFFAANTSTPQNAYKDTGLTLPHPNPITLDSAGFIPSFYLADGSIRVRLDNKSGVVQFDEANLLVLGPSSGGGGGSSVDATTIFQTGDVMWLDQSGARTGWVRDNARSIGSATSGASERANSDCQALHAFLWQNYSDTICPVNGGRGVSAAADWAANKYIGLPDKRGRSPFGLDGMGNSRANVITDAMVSSLTGDTAAASGGESSHTLTIPQLPVITPTGTVTANTAGTQEDRNILNDATDGSMSIIRNKTAGQVLTLAMNSIGGGSPYTSLTPFILGTFYRKL